jgi:hypothetical protein
MATVGASGACGFAAKLFIFIKSGGVGCQFRLI